MKKITPFFIFLLLSVNLFSQSDSQNVAKKAMPSGQKNTVKVFVFSMVQEIGPPAWRLTQKAFEHATSQKADIILIHLNTYGGRLDAADSIRTKILRSKIPVYVFIDNNAASAGALISIACDSIYMRPGSTIGAATVVNQSGEVVPDKYQSYMRAMMRATAQQTGRNPDIAEAMVDPSIKVPGVSDSGHVVTFTSTEAIKHGFCQAEAFSVDDVIRKAGFSQYQIVEHKLTWLDRFIAFLISPFVSGILIMIIIGGIYFELQTPGIGFPSAAALIAALLYFAPLYAEGLAAHWEILVFIVGIILLLIELFAIPGFGVIGFTGILLIVTGLSLSMLDNVNFDFRWVDSASVFRSFGIVTSAAFTSLVLSIFISKKVFEKPTSPLGKLALHTVMSPEDGFVGVKTDYHNLVGKRGVAHTMLRPSGKVIIDGEFYDATAQMGYVEKGEEVEVVKYETAQIVVRKIE